MDLEMPECSVTYLWGITSRTLKRRSSGLCSLSVSGWWFCSCGPALRPADSALRHVSLDCSSRGWGWQSWTCDSIRTQFHKWCHGSCSWCISMCSGPLEDHDHKPWHSCVSVRVSFIWTWLWATLVLELQLPTAPRTVNNSSMVLIIPSGSSR